MTFINDMDLIIRKTKFNKSIFVNSLNGNSTSDDVCYIKINMTLFNKTLLTLDQENQNNHRSRLEDKDLKFDIDKINLIQKNEVNKTKVIIVDKEVLINNNLKFFLNNHIKGLNKTNDLKINSFIIKKLTNAIDNSLSKRMDNNNSSKEINSNNNTYNISSESCVKVKKILNLESNRTQNIFITNITNCTQVKSFNNTTGNHKYHKQIKEKNDNDAIDISYNTNNSFKQDNKNKFVLNIENVTFSNDSIYKAKSIY